MTGVELCRELHAQAPEAVIVFYSAAARQTERAAGLRAGAQAYVAKPYVEQLLDTIDRLLPECAEPEA